MEIDVLATLFRVVHILAAIVAVGGAFYLRLVLLPAMGELGPEVSEKLHAATRARWSRVVGAATLLLLVSGLYTVMNTNRSYDLSSEYQMLFGIKFLLAFFVFFISSVLPGRTAVAERFRQRLSFWLTLNLMAAVILVILAGVLRMMPHVPKEPAQSVQTEQAVAIAPFQV